MSRKNLQSRVDQFARWYRITRTARLLQLVVFVTLLAMAVVMAANKLLYLSDDPLLLLGLTASPGLLIVLGYVLFGKRDARTATYLVDRNAGTTESCRIRS